MAVVHIYLVMIIRLMEGGTESDDDKVFGLLASRQALMLTRNCSEGMPQLLLLDKVIVRFLTCSSRQQPLNPPVNMHSWKLAFVAKLMPSSCSSALR